MPSTIDRERGNTSQEEHASSSSIRFAEVLRELGLAITAAERAANSVGDNRSKREAFLMLIHGKRNVIDEGKEAKDNLNSAMNLTASEIQIRAGALFIDDIGGPRVSISLVNYSRLLDDLRMLQDKAKRSGLNASVRLSMDSMASFKLNGTVSVHAISGFEQLQYKANGQEGVLHLISAKKANGR